MSKNAAHAGAQATVWQQIRRIGPLRLSLGGVALAGAAVATTSAGWTGNVTFDAPTSASTFVLQGSTTGANCDAATGWQGTDSAQGTLTLSLSDFGKLSPNTTVTKDVWVRNSPDSDENASVVLSDVSVTGDVFGTTSPGTGTVHPVIAGNAAGFTGTVGGATVAVALTGGTQPLEPFTADAATNGCAQVEVVVTTPSNWDYSYQGTSGTLTFTVSGQSTTTGRA